MKLKSTTQIALDNLIFTPTKRSRNKPKPIPTASEVKKLRPDLSTYSQTLVTR
ncbi:NinE family protein [Citrobacter sp.]|uniref:NinE family protein n=1 Tax=Citrobacter TaxID=544 RepID=UPI002901B911|nr:NinE family protein [Citrobacter sp.]MDU2844912.1 NinE family protein [Citrobacter sp.]